jgi:trk system potassium uptake protein TrkH
MQRELSFMPEELIYRKRRLSSFKIIILGFAGVILLGALLLMLPISTTGGNVTPFNETLFTSTSAVCVTGLVVRDTGSYWSTFGQTVILALIQIGGLGVVTVAASFALLSGRKISLMQRSTMQDAISAPKVGGIVRLTRFILRGTFLIELLGALAMLPVFCRDYGWRGIWMAVFHSVSAFCNAGFDILGTGNNLYPSLTSYAGSPIINITIMLLIVTGGIGFLTWDDICENKLHFHHYRMQSKVILVTTAFLLVLPAIFFFFVDFSSLPIGKRVLASFFQSVTPRTAGFNTVILSDMTGASQAVMIFLMMIGGSPGSTAGGMKTTTLAVLVANAAATFRQHESVQFFGRRIECGVVKTAATVVTMYLALFFGGAIFISVYENLPLSSCLYETASAVGTVGLTLGITPQLHIPSQMVLIMLMYLGRVGGLTLIYAALSGKRAETAKLPLDQIAVG